MTNATRSIWNLYGIIQPNASDFPAGSLIPAADNDPVRGAYGFSRVGYTTIAANPTDVFTIQGSASKTIRIRQLQVSGYATAAGSCGLNIIRRSSANSGGTSTVQTAGQRDTADDAPTATLLLYSANPTSLGTSLGVIDGSRMGLVASSGASQVDRLNFQYSWLNEKAPTLRGVNDFIALNFGGNALPAGTVLDIAAWWTEE